MGENGRCTQEGELATLRADSVTIFKRLDNLEKVNDTILELTKSVTKLAENMRETKDDVKSIDDKLTKIQAKPLERYEKIIIIVITLLISYVINKAMGV